MVEIYNEATKKLIHGFGDLFNNITIHRETSEGFKPVTIPIHFVPSSYDYQDILKHPDLLKIRPAITLPLLTYEITRYEIDNSRKENRYNSTLSCTADADGRFEVIRSPTPLSVGINLYLFTHYLDDVFEVQERIYTGFNPKITISIKHGNGVTSQVPISFSSVTKTDNYEGSPKEKSRLIMTTFSFDAKMDYYKTRGEKTDLIKTMTLNYADDTTGQTEITSTVEVDPIDADISDDWSIKTTLS